MKKIDNARVHSTVEPKILKRTSNAEDEEDSDSDSDSSENDEDKEIVNGGESINRGKNKNEKKTRAERNKMRRLSEHKQEVLKLKADKKLSHDLNSVKAIKKEIATEEQRKNIVKKERKALMKQKNSQVRTMSYSEAGSVLLTEELSGNLRNLKPEICPIKSHIATMISNGDAVDKNARKRKAYEKPHGGKQIKWVAKYKYV